MPFPKSLCKKLNQRCQTTVVHWSTFHLKSSTLTMLNRCLTLRLATWLAALWRVTADVGSCRGRPEVSVQELNSKVRRMSTHRLTMRRCCDVMSPEINFTKLNFMSSLLKIQWGSKLVVSIGTFILFFSSFLQSGTYSVCTSPIGMREHYVLLLLHICALQFCKMLRKFFLCA